MARGATFAPGASGKLLAKRIEAGFLSLGLLDPKGALLSCLLKRKGPGISLGGSTLISPGQEAGSPFARRSD